MSSEKFNIELTANALQMRQELNKSQKEVDKLRGKLDKADESTKGFELSASKLGNGIAIVGTAVVAATAAFTAYVSVQGRAIIETEALANMAGLTVGEFRKLSFVMGTVGISGEKFGDIMKDTQERVGDFIATGGGAFQDFADVMGYTEKQAQSLAKEFETMSGQEVLQAMYNRMEAAGKSTQRISFALEGMASDTTRLIPLLKEGGKATQELGSQFDKLDSPLSDEDREQFIKLANNIDLAQTVFVNFANNGVAPFVTKINEAAEALKGFYLSFSAGSDVDDLLDNQSLISGIDSLNQLEKIQGTVNARIADMTAAAIKYQEAGLSPSQWVEQVDSLNDLNNALAERINLLKLQASIAESFAEIDADNAPEEEESNKSGADKITDGENLEKELAALQDAKKTKLQLLREEKDERLLILSELYAGDLEQKEHYESLKRQVDQNYRLQILEETQTDAEAKQEVYNAELASLREFYNQKEISEEEYQAKLKEIIDEFAPATNNPELLEEQNQKELEALKALLDSKAILHTEYYERLAKLEKKDGKDKEEKKKKENWWSESSVKSQMEDGAQLLNYLGNNSKTAHKIKQNLAAANAGMNTAEGVTKALAEQNYPGAVLTAATGALQIAAILSSTPDSGGNTVAPPSEAPQPEPVQEYNEQSTNITDLSGGASSSQNWIIEFSDSTIDVLAIKVNEAQKMGRV